MLPALLLASGLVLPDGRVAHVLRDDAAVAGFIRSRVAELANAAIAETGAFSMSIGSGTTVAPLVELAGELDFSRLHLFFGNERTEGDAAGKCFDGAAALVEACAIPPENVHRVPSLVAEEAATQYEATILSSAREWGVGTCERTGLPALDLVLLGSGADGHCASLYPDSAQVVCSPGCQRMYLPAEGKGGVTLSIDAICSARNVILSAGKAAQAEMVHKCLAGSLEPMLPAGMLAASEGTQVEWLLTEASAVHLIP